MICVRNLRLHGGNQVGFRADGNHPWLAVLLRLDTNKRSVNYKKGKRGLSLRYKDRRLCFFTAVDGSTTSTGAVQVSRIFLNNLEPVLRSVTQRIQISSPESTDIWGT